LSRRNVLWFLLAFGSSLFLLCFVFFIAILQVSSGSMRDTLRERDYIVVLRTEFLTRHQLCPRISAHRGQIVVLQAPSDPSVVLVKRVSALGGDRIRIFNGKVILNGVVQNENYVVGTHGNIADSSWPSDWGLEGQRDIIVPADHYFVLGDNRDSSMDSRHWGSVPVENVIGKLLFSIRH
jgi:signal peptidase I